MRTGLSKFEMDLTLTVVRILKLHVTDQLWPFSVSTVAVTVNPALASTATADAVPLHDTQISMVFGD